ncbi:hypothetical protein RCH19_002959 [Flavobacterium sp. PL12]
MSFTTLLKVAANLSIGGVYLPKVATVANGLFVNNI